ncbi:MAG: toll/interleukin-1 receptor domain-containing protein [Sedimenticolaceae bacterium]
MNYGVFLSYRRADTAGHAGRICDDLERHFGFPVVFRDIDSIKVGSDFVQALEAAVANATVAIVLIGETWLSEASADGSPRINSPEDHVHREVVMALSKPFLTVIPVLVEGASMPAEKELPEPLRDLARLQAIELSDSRWGYDIQRLAQVLETAGIHIGSRRLPRWFAPLAGVLLAAAIAAFAWCWQGSTAAIDEYTGLWHLPNGSFWTVREKEGGLWVEETHNDSKQVWKRGPAKIDADGLSAELDLVFDREPLLYLHRLRLSDDHQSLIGSVRRSDQKVETSLVLTRGTQ